MDMMMMLGAGVTFAIWTVVLIVFIAMYFKMDSMNEHLKKIRTVIEWQVSKDPKM